MILHNFLLAAWFPFGLLHLGSGCICMVILTQEGTNQYTYSLIIVACWSRNKIVWCLRGTVSHQRKEQNQWFAFFKKMHILAMLKDDKTEPTSEFPVLLIFCWWQRGNNWGIRCRLLIKLINSPLGVLIASRSLSSYWQETGWPGGFLVL